MRHLDRESLDLSPINPEIDSYLFGRSIKGNPSDKQRDHKATQSCWDRGLKNPRLAWTGPRGMEKVNTVKVIHASGKTEIVPSSSFRRQNIAKKQAQHTQARVARRTAADLPRQTLDH